MGGSNARWGLLLVALLCSTVVVLAGRRSSSVHSRHAEIARAVGKFGKYLETVWYRRRPSGEIVRPHKLGLNNGLGRTPQMGYVQVWAHVTAQGRIQTPLLKLIERLMPTDLSRIGILVDDDSPRS